jgi:dephospho-CoA kinase
MLKIGITGGIGSGKTLVCEVFSKMGVPVYQSDEESKQLLDTNKVLKAQLIGIFGDNIYTNAGLLDRKALADIVFNNTEALKQLNAVVHPLVRQHFLAWLQEQHAKYILKEAAILFESKANIGLDKTIMVYSPLELRITRAMKRDGITRDAVMSRLEKQMPDEEKLKLCDFVLYNDEVQPLLPQIIVLHQQIMNLAN